MVVRDLVLSLAWPAAIILVSQAFRPTAPLVRRDPCPACQAIYALLLLQGVAAIWLVARRPGRRLLYAIVLLFELLLGVWVAFIGQMFLTGRYL